MHRRLTGRCSRRAAPVSRADFDARTPLAAERQGVRPAKNKMEGTTEEPNDVCGRVGVAPDPPSDFQKVGIALETLHLEPLNGLRHPAQGDTCGWFIWGGPELSQAQDFFKSLHVAHLSERCPAALKYLALPAGWRFLDAGGREDVWHDPALLDV
jgi:hypothetical protein